MSRQTQYIGLTHRATEFVSKLTRVENSTNHTTGMCDEEVPLGEWTYTQKIPTGWDNEEETFRVNYYRVKEVVQEEPWSGGPMIFTCLEFTPIQEGKSRTDCIYRGFEWTENPSLAEQQVEVDTEHGEYYV